MKNHEATLIEAPEKVSLDHYRLRIRIPGAKPAPGQFINIKIGPGTDPLLRRPFSVFDYDGEIVSVIVRAVGRGTRFLSHMRPGGIDVIAPLGEGFTVIKNSRVILAGGGVGNAPLYYLTRMLKKNNNHITYIYGHRSMEHVFLADAYRGIADELIIATDDGSGGVKGNAVEITAGIEGIDSFDAWYTCGPAVMMKKLAEVCGNTKPIEVSMENYFGCGIGLCSGCTIECTDGLKRACVDGPVFDGRKVIW